MKNEEEYYEREAKGIYIPIEIWESDELTPIEKFLYATIDSFNDEKTGCDLSNKDLGEYLLKTSSTISKGISKLKAMGLVKEISFNGRQRTLKTFHRLKEDS